MDGTRNLFLEHLQEEVKNFMERIREDGELPSLNQTSIKEINLMTIFHLFQPLEHYFTRKASLSMN